MKFQKKATPPSELIPLLQTRGLVVESSEEAIKCLANIGYYRFSGYAYPFLEGKKEHIFIKGTSFNQIINCYNFDRQLRFLLTEALHYIEISVRTIISDTMSLAINPHWFLNKSAFQPAYITNPKGYNKLLSIIAEKSGKLDKENPIRMQNREDFITLAGYYSCERCGDYALHDRNLLEGLRDNLRSSLSKIVRVITNKSDVGSKKFEITAQTLGDLHPITPIEKADNLILFLGGKQNYTGEYVEIIQEDALKVAALIGLAVCNYGKDFSNHSPSFSSPSFL